MSTYQFFNHNFGRFLTRQTNQPFMDTWNTLSLTHKIINKDGKNTASRLVFGWAIIRPTGSSVWVNLTGKEIKHDPRKWHEAFADELARWDDTPRMFLMFNKAPISITNLFLTLDLRAVRICSPGGVETFDYTKPAHPKSGRMQRALEKQRAKNAA